MSLNYTAHRTTYDGEFFRNRTTRQAIFAHSRADPFMAFARKKSANIFRTLKDSLGTRRTTFAEKQNRCVRTWKSRERTFYARYPGTRTVNVVPATQRQKEENASLSRLYKKNLQKSLRPVEMKTSNKLRRNIDSLH